MKRFVNCKFCFIDAFYRKVTSVGVSILFFGRGRGRGGRATAKRGGFRSVVQTVLPYNGADGSGGQDFFILFPVFGGVMARQKSRLSRV